VGFACVAIVAVLEGFGEEQAGGQVFGVFMDDLAEEGFGAILIPIG
jgi:hypothetical protein